MLRAPDDEHSMPCRPGQETCRGQHGHALTCRWTLAAAGVRERIMAIIGVRRVADRDQRSFCLTLCQISFAQPRGRPLRAAYAVIRSSRSLDIPFVGTPAMHNEATEMLDRLQPVVNAFDDASTRGFGPSLMELAQTCVCLPPSSFCRFSGVRGCRRPADF